MQPPHYILLKIESLNHNKNAFSRNLNSEILLKSTMGTLVVNGLQGRLKTC